MIKAFFGNKRWAWWAYGVGLSLILLSYGLVDLSVRFNTWYGDFYNIMQKPSAHTLAEYQAGIWQFLMLAVIYIAVSSALSLVSQFYSVKWREAITLSFAERWRNVSASIEGESQRLQEDTMAYADIMESLALEVINAIMTLIRFVPVLWVLSHGINFWLLTKVPGSLVWVALIVSVGGMTITWLVAIKLPKLEYNNQVVEAAYRKELVLAEVDKANHASFPTIIELFTGVKRSYYRLYWHTSYVNLWLNMYGQSMVIIPYIIMGPALMSGVAPLGVVVQVSNAFGEVRSSLAVFINNWKRITKVRSIWRRLHEFEANIDNNQQSG